MDRAIAAARRDVRRRRLAGNLGSRTGGHPVRARPTPPRGGRAPVAPRGDRDGQADPLRPGPRDRARHRPDPVLRQRRPDDPGRGDGVRPEPPPQLHPQGAGRSVRADHAAGTTRSTCHCARSAPRSRPAARSFSSPPATPRRRRWRSSGCSTASRSCQRASPTGSSGPGEVVGETLATDPRVDKISFTGSSEVGRRLMELGARTFKRVSLEAGGKAPVIVFPDANLDKAMDAVSVGIFLYAGQSCTAGRGCSSSARSTTVSSRDWSSAPTRLRVGSPLDDETQLGPMVSRRQLDRVLGYVERGATRARGSSSVAAARWRLVGRALHGADDLRRRRPVDDHRPRGDLRAGPVGHPVRHARRRRSRWPTTTSSGSAARSGRATSIGPSGSPGGFGSATCGSTPTTSAWPRVRSAASSRAASGASSAWKAWTPTSSPSGSASTARRRSTSAEVTARRLPAARRRGRGGRSASASTAARSRASKASRWPSRCSPRTESPCRGASGSTGRAG